MGVGAAGGAAIAAGVGAAGSLAGGLISSSGAQAAAKTQAAAQEQAAQLQEQQNQTNMANLGPYDLNGQAGIGNLNSVIANNATNLGAAYGQAQAAMPTQMTQAQLVNTPGYEFTLAQGLQGVQNSATSRGLGVSSAALQGAGTYATGLANQTYTQQLANQNTIYQAANQQFSNAYNGTNALYNQAFGPVQLGENAAAQSGYQGNTAAANIGSNIAGAGSSLASGIQSSANTIGNSVSGLGNSGYTYLALNNALGGANNTNGYGATSTYTNPVDGLAYQSSSNPNANF